MAARYGGFRRQRRWCRRHCCNDESQSIALLLRQLSVWSEEHGLESMPASLSSFSVIGPRCYQLLPAPPPPDEPPLLEPLELLLDDDEELEDEEVEIWAMVNFSLCR